MEMEFLVHRGYNDRGRKMGSRWRPRGWTERRREILRRKQLLVIDRGNRAIRAIQLHFDDCACQYGTGFPLGIAMLLGAGFFGYMLALLQRRVGTIVSSQNDQSLEKTPYAPSAYQKPMKSVRPPLIRTEDDPEKQEEGFFGSLAKLLANAGTSVTDILGGIFPFLRRKNHPTEYQHQYQKQSWPVQESFVIPDEDEPPSIETRTPTPRKTYPFMSRATGGTRPRLSSPSTTAIPSSTTTTFGAEPIPWPTTTTTPNDGCEKCTW